MTQISGSLVGGEKLIIQEIDGSPKGSPSILKVTNGSLTNNGDGSFTLSTGGGSGTGITWNHVTSTTQAGAVNNGYILNNASLVTLTLPATAAIGDMVIAVGKGAGGWRVAQNSGQIIHFGNLDTTTGVTGSIDSTLQSDVIYLICTTANTDFEVVSSVGNLNVL